MSENSRSNLFYFSSEFDRTKVVEENTDMDEVYGDKVCIPEESVQGAQHCPAPQGVQSTADEEGAPQVEDAVGAVGRQVRQKEECVGHLEV